MATVEDLLKQGAGGGEADQFAVDPKLAAALDESMAGAVRLVEEEREAGARYAKLKSRNVLRCRVAGYASNAADLWVGMFVGAALENANAQNIITGFEETALAVAAIGLGILAMERCGARLHRELHRCWDTSLHHYGIYHWRVKDPKSDPLCCDLYAVMHGVSIGITYNSLTSMPATVKSLALSGVAQFGRAERWLRGCEQTPTP